MQVQLRPMAGGDTARLLAWRNCDDVAAFMYSDHKIADEEHARWFAAALRDPRRAYWLIEADGAPVGLANLYDIDAAQGRCAWAFYLAELQARGRGLGAWVEYRMIQEAFAHRGLRKLWCEVLASNAAALRLHLSFGFVEEARLRAHVVKQGAPQDVIGLGLLADDWAALRPAAEARLRQRGLTI